jgi:hypothetical protein
MIASTIAILVPITSFRFSSQVVDMPGCGTGYVPSDPNNHLKSLFLDFAFKHAYLVNLTTHVL